MDPITENWDFIVPHSVLLLRSYRHWTGKDLIERTGDAEIDARSLFQAPFVIVSGGTESEQVLNYGNASALKLWQMDWATLTRMPSRQTAEPMHQSERAEFLRRVREQGFIDDYSGIRIASTGQRFRIQQATVWNLVNEAGEYLGQAATFSEWYFLK